MVTGYGTVDGRQVCVFAQDFTVFGGSLGEVFGEKIVKVMDLAMKIGCPVVGINDSGGARIQEGVVSLGLYGEIFFRNVQASGVIPQISLIMGPCAGGAVYSPAITDFTVMVDQTSHMFITGPDVIKTVTGEDVALRGARRRPHPQHQVRRRALPGRRRGGRDRLRQGAAVATCRRNNLDDAARRTTARRRPGGHRRGPRAGHAVPDSANQPYDMHTVIEHVLDDGEFLEVQALFAPNIVVGFGRVEGRPVGVVANQPMQFAGTLDIDASEKAARFVRTCDAFNIPVLTFVDVPGFLPGTVAGVGRHHPPRRQAHLRLRRGDRAEGHRHHPQGVRRRVRRHGLQAPGRRPQPRLADRADRGDGRAGRGEHPLPHASWRERRRPRPTRRARS